MAKAVPFIVVVLCLVVVQTGLFHYDCDLLTGDRFGAYGILVKKFAEHAHANPVIFRCLSTGSRACLLYFANTAAASLETQHAFPYCSLLQLYLRGGCYSPKPFESWPCSSPLG